MSKDVIWGYWPSVSFTVFGVLGLTGTEQPWNIFWLVSLAAALLHAVRTTRRLRTRGRTGRHGSDATRA